MNLKNQITWLNNRNLDLFDNCEVPDGLDFQAVKSSIIMRCSLLTPLYSEPMTQRAATMQFFIENQWNFKHLIKIVEAEYSPIENVHEETEELTGDKLQRNSNRNSNDSTENQVSAENIAYYQPNSKNTKLYNETESGTDNRDINFKRIRHGNIGVTTNTQLINEELKLIKSFNVYKKIADLYTDSLMLQIY